MLPTSAPLPIPGEDAAFDKWIEGEAGPGASARWLGTPAYENSRVQDCRTGWVAALEWLIALMGQKEGQRPAYMSDGEKAYRMDILERWPAHNRARYTIPLYAVTLPSAPASSEEEGAGTWRVAGSMLYRLTDERRPENRDEIRVGMVDGSRDETACARRALELLPAVMALTAGGSGG